MQHQQPDKTFADFFSGIGLMRLGLEQQGWKSLFANDIDPQKYQMYRAHFQDADRHFILADIRRLTSNDIPTVTLATASFPCNDLSLAGRYAGLNGEHSSVFWEFIRLLEEIGKRKPPIVLIENVAGFLTSRKGADLCQALLALNRVGYSVDVFFLDAAHFVPQSRQRLFIIGVSDQWLKPEKSCMLFVQESETRPGKLVDLILVHPEIRWYLHELPPPPQREMGLESILDELPDDAPEWWDIERAHYLLNQMSPRHKKIAYSMMEKAEWSYGTVFRRVRNGRSMAELRTDGLAGCLRTPRGGSGRQILFKAGKGCYRVRLLTPRECARLMGAADYAISVPLNQALWGFGDAVCVPVIRWIAENILDGLVRHRDSNCPGKRTEDQEIIQAYNRRLGQVETDLSLQIEVR